MKDSNEETEWAAIRQAKDLTILDFVLVGSATPQAKSSSSSYTQSELTRKEKINLKHIT